jgi:L-fuconolactonase
MNHFTGPTGTAPMQGRTVGEARQESHDEPVLDPERPIVDPHHHLWDRGPANRYLLPELLADIQGSGHNIRATMFVECSSMYRADGDPRFASLGEVEFANGVGAMCASGGYGDVRACSGIIGRVDLTQGAAAAEVLAAMLERAPDRLRGIRQMAAWDASPEVSTLVRPPPPNLLADPGFREGFACLGPLGLSFDVWVYHPQLPQVIELADTFPDTTIVLNHMGGRAAVGPYRSRAAAEAQEWAANIAALARRPNVMVKIGGIGMKLAGFDFYERGLPPSSEELAAAWKPYVDTCIEAFSPQRSMLESNFPVDKTCCTYRVLWNGLKRLVADYSRDEKDALFAGCAIRTYRLPVSLP